MKFADAKDHHRNVWIVQSIVRQLPLLYTNALAGRSRFEGTTNLPGDVNVESFSSSSFDRAFTLAGFASLSNRAWRFSDRALVALLRSVFEGDEAFEGFDTSALTCRCPDGASVSGCLDDFRNVDFEGRSPAA